LDSVGSRDVNPSASPLAKARFSFVRWHCRRVHSQASQVQFAFRIRGDLFYFVETEAHYFFSCCISFECGDDFARDSASKKAGALETLQNVFNVFQFERCLLSSAERNGQV
jgi:hypothetical protein